MTTADFPSGVTAVAASPRDRPALDVVWAALATVPDPEIPVISIVELGIVRGVSWEGAPICCCTTEVENGHRAVLRLCRSDQTHESLNPSTAQSRRERVRVGVIGESLNERKLGLSTGLFGSCSRIKHPVGHHTLVAFSVAG